MRSRDIWNNFATMQTRHESKVNSGGGTSNQHYLPITQRKKVWLQACPLFVAVFNMIG